jgi:hypothetical protein
MNAPKHLSKYLIKNTNNSNNYEIYKKAMTNYDNGIKIIDDSEEVGFSIPFEESILYLILDNKIDRVKKLNDEVIWKELDEDELVQTKPNEENQLGRKRERYILTNIRLDSDSENDNIDSELAELLDEDDIDIDDKKGIQISFLSNKKNIIRDPEANTHKTVHRDKTGKIIDPLTESKEAKVKELERRNYENV